jgi:hypothetical protein
MAWCGARNGRAVASGVSGRTSPAADSTWVTLQGVVAVQVGQQSAQAPGEHGLAGARRADQQQVVAAGGGDLERAAGERLAADVAQVLDRGGWCRAGRAGRVQPALAAEERVDLAEGGRPADPQAWDQRRLRQVGRGHHQQAGAAVAGGDGGGEHPTHRADVATQAELADRPQVLDGRLRHHPGRGQQPDADR